MRYFTTSLLFVALVTVSLVGVSNASPYQEDPSWDWYYENDHQVLKSRRYYDDRRAVDDALSSYKKRYTNARQDIDLYVAKIHDLQQQVRDLKAQVVQLKAERNALQAKLDTRKHRTPPKTKKPSTVRPKAPVYLLPQVKNVKVYRPRSTTLDIVWTPMKTTSGYVNGKWRTFNSRNVVYEIQIGALVGNQFFLSNTYHVSGSIRARGPIRLQRLKESPYGQSVRIRATSGPVQGKWSNFVSVNRW